MTSTAPIRQGRERYTLQAAADNLRWILDQSQSQSRGSGLRPPLSKEKLDDALRRLLSGDTGPFPAQGAGAGGPAPPSAPEVDAPPPMVPDSWGAAPGAAPSPATGGPMPAPPSAPEVDAPPLPPGPRFLGPSQGGVGPMPPPPTRAELIEQKMMSHPAWHPTTTDLWPRRRLSETEGYHRFMLGLGKALRAHPNNYRDHQEIVEAADRAAENEAAVEAEAARELAEMQRARERYISSLPSGRAALPAAQDRIDALLEQIGGEPTEVDLSGVPGPRFLGPEHGGVGPALPGPAALQYPMEKAAAVLGEMTPEQRARLAEVLRQIGPPLLGAR